jgi:hypothetical protein
MQFLHNGQDKLGVKAHPSQTANSGNFICTALPRQPGLQAAVGIASVKTKEQRRGGSYHH